MLHTIGNECLCVTVSEKGAELQSVLGSDGTEYLWQGDPAYWPDRALTIFPYVARLTDGKYKMDGKTYAMQIHGFAPSSLFELEEKTGTSVAFLLRSSDEMFAQYPRAFEFRVIYALENRTLSVSYFVKNCDARRMYFGLGGHSGFNVPLETGGRFEDYRLRFAHSCRPYRVGFSKDCFVNGQDVPFALEGGCVLPLCHDLFDDDAIVLRDMAHEVTLETENGEHAVTISYPDMPYLGIWHWPKTNAPYVCIEPWRSLPAREGEITVFEQQVDLVHLDPGCEYRNTWKITIR